MGSLRSELSSVLCEAAIVLAGQVRWLAAGVAFLALCQNVAAVADNNDTARPSFSDYRFDFSLVEDTVIPGQQVWLRAAEANVTDHDVPLLNMFPGGPVFRVVLIDSAGAPCKVKIPHVDDWMDAKGTLKPGESRMIYHNIGPDMWFFTAESLYATLVGHTWGLAIQFSTYVFGDPDSLKMKRPPLPLTVIKATGPEAEAVALLKQGKCREMVERFPRSRFVDEALRALHFMANASEQLEIAREQARINPGSPQLIGWARLIKRQLGVSAYNSFVAELALNHPKAAALEVLKEVR
jgi:hypothetical protein